MQSGPVKAATAKTDAECGGTQPASGDGVDPQYLAPDDQLLDFGGAVGDGEHTGVAEVALHRVLLRETVSAVNLDRLGRYVHAHPRGEELGKGALAAAAHVLVEQLEGAVGEKTRGVGFGDHIRDHLPEQLEAPDGPAGL